MTRGERDTARVVVVHSDDAATRARLRAIARAAATDTTRAPVTIAIVADAVQARAILRCRLVDALLVDVRERAGAEIALLARAFAHVPVFAYVALHRDAAPLLAWCASTGVRDVIVAGVDDATAHALVAPRTFSRRLASRLRAAGDSMASRTPLQRAAWALIVARCGQPIGTPAIAAALGVRRERLSREFGDARGGATLKRTIDVVRCAAAAALLASDDVSVEDAARILGVSSASQLSALARRTAGTSARGLARLGATELTERFVARDRHGARSDG